MNDVTSEPGTVEHESLHDDHATRLDSAGQQALPETTESSNPAAKLIGGVLRGIPTLIILGVLAGLALWGHHYGWSLPKFSELTGNVPEKGVAWCDEHGVAEAECISCNVELMPKDELHGWCSEHGVHECVLHNPQLAQVSETPAVDAGDFDRAARAIATRPRTKNDPSCKMHLRRIQFPSIEAVDQAGIDINLVDRGPVIETIKTTGEIVYDPTLVAQLASRADGAIWRVQKNVGDFVKQGEVLALVDAADVGRAKSQLLNAVVQLQLNSKVVARLSNLDEGVVAGKRIDEAESAKTESAVAVQNAIQALANLGLAVSDDHLSERPVPEIRSELKFLGLPDSVMASIDQTRASANLIPVVSPRDGVIVMRDAASGEVVGTNKPLFIVADTSQMWLLLNVRLEEAERVSLGQKIVFQPDGSEQASIGKVTWISTEVDVQTRTIRVRGELANADGRLRNETFGTGEIVLRDEQNAIIVPQAAIHWEGCCHIAFVRDKGYFKEGSYKVFHTRSVRPGAIMGDNTEVIAGLLPGEVVVTEGSGILRAELLKGHLGAG